MAWLVLCCSACGSPLPCQSVSNNWSQLWAPTTISLYLSNPQVSPVTYTYITIDFNRLDCIAS